MRNDTSLICQFNFEQSEGLTARLIECTEALFSLFHYPIKKVYTFSGEKNLSPTYQKLKVFTNPDYFDTITFRSDYRKEDFEPQTRLHVCIDNSLTKGSPYTLPKSMVKFTVVVNDVCLIEHIDRTYASILLPLSEIPQRKTAGYSFLFPNRYGAVSFSFGVLRSANLPRPLQDLARWYRDSDTEKCVPGLFNCFTGLAQKQIEALKRVVGQENISSVKEIVYFKNKFMDSTDPSDCLTSDAYRNFCDRLSGEFYFLGETRAY
ncbi:MAG: hypothetical protein NC084_06685 [Bacteroides sp.]|nr:hypothetical protein [Eubacterium sp.]MCM1418282.1 hypothetical protein [Roseburia sp.]MCM1462385.1 hypothetical protein [Bacteroides sp.]